jgi:hypothetical protein
LLVAPLNQQAADLWTKYAGSPNGRISRLGTYTAYCAEAAALEERWIPQVQAFPWPADVRPKVDALLAADVTLAGRYHECARATSWDQIGAMNLPAAEQAAYDAATQVRAALGLPLGR